MKKQLIIIGMTVIIAIGLCGCTDTQDNTLDGLGYINNQYGFGLNPPEGWTVDESGISGAIVAFIGPGQDNLAIINDELGSSETLSSVADQIIEFNENNYENYSFLSRIEITINGMNAYEIVVSHSYQNYQLKEKKVMIEKNSKIIRLDYTAEVSTYDTHLSIVEQSINSFKMR